MTVDTRSSHLRIRLAIAGAVVLSSLGYLVERILRFSDQSSIDFRHTWVAGRMWVDGANPYSDDFARIGAESFASGDLPRIWVYPPNWFFVATPFDLVGDVTGSIIWNIASSVLMVLACWLLAGVVVAEVHGFPRWSRRLLHTGRDDVDRFVLFAVHLGFVTFLQGTAISLTTGQTGTIALFAMALLVWALVTDRQVWGIVAIALLMLKPQVGVIICVGLLFDRSNWGLVSKAAIATAVSALPAFLVASPGDVLSGMFDNWDALYAADYQPTNADRISGVRNLADWVGLDDIGVQVGVVLALVTLGALEGWSRRRQDRGEWWIDSSLGTMVGSIAVIVAFVTLQTYDLSMIGVLLVVGLGSRGPRLALFLVAVALLYRPQNLAQQLPTDSITSGRLEVIGGLLLFVAAVGFLLERKPRLREPGG